MRLRKKTKRVLSGAGVALATSGLSTCGDNGTGDPPPPPFECTALVTSGGVLAADATRTGTVLQVRIRNNSASRWTEARVTSVVGGSARPLELANPLMVVIDLTDETVTSGSFALSGTLEGYPASCPVSRTFQFRIENETVVVTVADELPLSVRQAVRIALRSRQGRLVELEAESSVGSDSTLTWTVTAGEIVRKDGPRLSWRLPAEAGFYQAQLVVDRGPRGLSFDALALEVGGD